MSLALLHNENFDYPKKANSESNLDKMISLAETATKSIAPAWPLDNFVAVNPYWGLKDKDFLAAAEELRKIAGESLFPSPDYYLEIFAKNPIKSSELHSAALEANISARKRVKQSHLNVDLLIRQLRTLSENLKLEKNKDLCTFSNFIELRGEAQNISNLITDEISKFCSIYFDKGQAAFRSGLCKKDLFSAWKEFASIDKTMKLSGVKGFEIFIEDHAHSAADMLKYVYETLDVSEDLYLNYLKINLFSIKGWASYIAHLNFEENKKSLSSDRLVALLAIRLAYDCYFMQTSNHKTLFEYIDLISSATDFRSNEECLYLSQLIIEKRFIKEISNKLKLRQELSAERKALQAIFCIDVRSENLRRNLELQSLKVETYGFAGFFGIALELCHDGFDSHSSQYPVLLSPAFQVLDKHTKTEAFNYNFKSLIRSLRQSISSGFSYVEAMGIFYVKDLLRDSLLLRKKTKLQTKGEIEIKLNLEQKLSAAISILKNSGLRAPYAKSVILCGHKSQTENNPFHSGLQCGACGGNSGEINAVVACSILNDWAVRNKIKNSGYDIPLDTIFIPAVHCTTTDEIEILEHKDSLQPEVSDWIKTASAIARLNRREALGLEPGPSTHQAVFQRARDWSEIRPEWGLAGNAAFIAARRDRTRSQNLNGRCFLHEYDCDFDNEYKTLELIMTAPMIVANWINMQYYASSVSPSFFGSGNKTIHNVVSQLGVLEGNSGDLKIGLPFQSVHNGKHFMHEPLRLHVILEAPEEAITSIIQKHTLLQELIYNGWLKVFALDCNSKQLHHLAGKEIWIS